MKEFGSDYHRCDYDFRGYSNYIENLGCTRFYACGRHAIDAIVKHSGWKRIWIPAYFCYEVIGHIQRTGIEVVLYDDHPLNERDEEVVRNLPYEQGDVLLRTDYFGLREWRTNKGIRVPVIEDHTHGLITDWALNSDADWCIASLRKSFPVAAGGILWSPKKLQLPQVIGPSVECSEMAKIRYDAMNMKATYLKESYHTEKEALEVKNTFREKYLKSEEMIDTLALSGIDLSSGEMIRTLDIKQWIGSKFDNWRICVDLLGDRFNILRAKDEDRWQPFSLILLSNSAKEREELRKYLVQNQIYPAVLWRLPDNSEFSIAKNFSDRMLSVHCDARYSQEAIKEMCKIINRFYDTDI